MSNFVDDVNEILDGLIEYLEQRETRDLPFDEIISRLDRTKFTLQMVGFKEHYRNLRSVK